MTRFLSIQGIVSWLGVSSIVIFFSSLTFLTGWQLTRIKEHALEERAQTLAWHLSSTTVEPLLFEDSYQVLNALNQAVSSNADVKYAYILGRDGTVPYHTFRKGFPRELHKIRMAHGKQALIYEAEDEQLLEVSTCLLEGQMGTLCLGVYRSEVFVEQRRFVMVMSGILAFSLACTFAVARWIGIHVGRPLSQLTEQVQLVPRGLLRTDQIDIHQGNHEVRSLALAFREMVRELHRLEHESHAAQQRMVSAERRAALGELAAGLAHEIMNPLDGVLEGCRQVRRQVTDNRRLAKYLLLMDSGLGRIERVMRQMLEFARGPTAETNIQEFVLKDLIDETIQFASPRLKGKRVNLTLELDPNLLASADRQLLSQALLNLLLNAADACDLRQPKISIRTGVKEDWCWLIVEDNGPGIEDELMEKVFTPFFTTKDPDKGSGLGLSMARQNIQQFGGSLELDGSLGGLGGASFRILIPGRNA